MADEPTQTTGDAQAAPAPARDLSQYIRTYAKDVAKLSGKGNVGALPLPKPTSRRPDPTPTPHARPAALAKPHGEVSDGVEFDATEQPFFERQAPKAEEMNYGPVDVGTKADADSIIEKRPSAVPMPASMAPPTPPKEDKETVLARLREKMAGYTPPAPTPSVEVAPELPVAAPVFAAPEEPPVNALPPLYREPIPVEEPTLSFTRPVPAPVPETPKTDAAVSDRFHSYATDFSQQVTATDASPFSVIAAQQDAKPSAPARVAVNKSRTPVLAIVLGSVLLVLSAGGAYGAYLYIAARHVVPTVATKVPSLVFADESKELKGTTGTELLQDLALVSNEPLVSGNVLITYIAQPATGEAGVIAGAPAKGGQLIKALELPAPDILLRNIAEESTVGITHQGSETRAFFILRVSSYERTFAGMLTWEPLMQRTLGVLYPLYPAQEVASPETLGTTTAAATSTASTPVAAASKIRFEDAVVSNRDVRILRDTTGRALMLYGYADKETLIIARDEAAFSALLTRLSAASQQ